MGRGNLKKGEEKKGKERKREEKKEEEKREGEGCRSQIVNIHRFERLILVLDAINIVN